MSFGLWFEPEMISPDSSVHRKHPHWALGAQDQILGRHQKALNMALAEVRDFLFDRIGVTGAKVAQLPITASKLAVLGSIGLWGVKINTIYPEETERGVERHSFVAINKGVI